MMDTGPLEESKVCVLRRLGANRLMSNNCRERKRIIVGKERDNGVF